MAEATQREFVLGEGTGGGSQNMLVGLGPSHPAMHGIIRITAELDGETFVRADVEIGYLHRAFEKDCEAGCWNNAIPYTDRLNYVSPLINNFGYCAAVEKLLGIEVTERCKYIRVIMSEISRVCDHLTCIGATALEPDAPRRRRPLRRAAGATVRRLRPPGVGDPDAEGRRQLRAVPRAHRRDGAVHAHRRAGARDDPGRADQRRRRGAADRPRRLRGT